MSESPILPPNASDPAHLHGEGVGTDQNAGGNGRPAGADFRDGDAPLSAGEAPGQVLHTVMFTDIESSVSLTGMLGQKRYAEVLTRHGELFYEALGEVRAVRIENTGDGFMARFERAAEAVGVALRFQWLLRREAWDVGHPLRVRVGIHQGEILLMAPLRALPEMVGTAVSLASRVMRMADGGQVLLTRAVFDEARQSIPAVPGVPAGQQDALGWEAHGAYLVRGIEGPIEVFEVGECGQAPFRRPRNGADAERSVSAEEEATLGWRPAAEMEVPKRPGWRLVRRLGQGGFGEVWLAVERATGEQRVFKFCFDVVKLRSFKRELKLFQFIWKALGPRPDIATLYEVQLESSPYFLESAYCTGGTLDEWLARRLREGEVPLPQRLAAVAAIARALGAAHSVGIIHKDVKPSNVFIEERPDGTVQPLLADFGIGELANRAAVDAMNLSVTGMWTMTEDLQHSGTQMYSAPEYMMAGEASVLGDIFSLGVLLYQAVVADFRRPMATGWRRDVPDDLLAEDIAACVDVDPGLRLSSAVLVAERLETLEQRRAELAAQQAAARRKRELEEQVRAQRRRIQLSFIVGGVALVVIAALLVAALMFRHARNQAEEHSIAMAAQREKEQDGRYREDMIAAIANIDNWRGEAARELVERHRPGIGERDRRGWEWWLANSALNPRHDFCQVSTEPLRALAVSPDETRAAVAGDDGNVSIRSCATLDELESWSAGAPVLSLAWKGDVLALGLASGEVVLREVTAHHDQRRWKAHEGAVAAMGWDPVHDELTTGGADGVVAWWQGDGTPLLSLKKQGPVLALDWEPDGRQLAAVLGNPTRLIAATPEAFDHEYPLDMPESAVAWRPGANEVAVSMNRKPMSSFDPLRADDTFSLARRYSPGASAFAWAPDGARVAVGGTDGKILVFEALNSKEMRPALYGHNDRVTALRWLRGERLLSIGEDGTLRTWNDLRRPAHVAPIAFPAPLGAAQWHPTDGRLAVLMAGDEVQVLDAFRHVIWSNPLPPPIRGHLQFIGGRLAWSPDGLWLAAVCPGRGLVAWRMDDGKLFVPAGLGDASDVRWRDDSRHLLVRTGKGWIRLGLEDGSSSPATDQQAGWIGDLGGGVLAKVGPVAGTIHFTVAREDAPPSLDVALPGELGAVQACSLNADRSRLAVAGESGVLVWLDTHTGALTPLPRTQSGAIQAIGWHPDGSRLVTASLDGTCRVIDVAHRVETWVVEHQLDPEIVAAEWSRDGRRLMLASAAGREVKIYEIAQTSDRSASVPPADLLAAIEQHPDEESGWSALAQALRSSEDQDAPILRAAAELGVQARFAPLAFQRVAGASPATAWEGAPLPRALRVAQACALERWEEVVTLSGEPGGRDSTGWFASARAEALAHLGRKQQSEAASLEAWQNLRQGHGAQDFDTVPAPTGNGKSTVDLTPWTTARPQNDWVFEDSRGNENNNLRELLKQGVATQPDGVQFRCGDFILLAGKTVRLTTGLMLPRSTGWIPLNGASSQVSCMLAACNVYEPKNYTDTCVGCIFLLRRDGGAVRIPLVFGRNIWRWWTPMEPQSFDAPPEAVAWRGTNPRASFFGNNLALYRLDWTAEAGDSPVVAISIASTLRQPAPLLMAVDARP